MTNIAELLKDVPEGTELWCTLYGKVKFISVDFRRLYPIKIKLSDTSTEELDVYGRCYNYFEEAECILFPSKDCRTWERWKSPIEPKFKVGDEIKTRNTIETIAEVDLVTRSYCCESGRTIWFENQDLWHLAPKKHYAIANFKPFDKVLVRCSNDEEWMIEFYCKYDTLVHTSPHRDYPFMGIGDSYSQCIPFNEKTKNLLGTADMPSEEYINW